MVTKQFLIISSILIALFCASTSGLTPAQSPSQTPAQAPAKPLAQPPAKPKTPVASSGQAPLSQEPIVESPPHKGRSRIPTDVTGILEKVGGFSVFIRLLKSTEVVTQVENQLSASNSLTILAPTNDAFASTLKPGTLNTLTNEQKVQLIQYHVLPTFISLANFQTLSNPVRTQASNTYDYPMNITTEGNWVNISTGIVNASITATVFSDNQLAIYRVDKVLLPLGVFAPRPKLPPAPAPALVANPKDSSSNSSLTTSTASDGSAEESNASGAPGLSGTGTVSTFGLIAMVAAVLVLV
ncbi:FAS1 domain containing protein [Parasponia andersonii]|uniref:FAS1 domain containing protein n=1 Tax=Parasponia andersonii TaxID=3476 RepID=A0A2P5BYS7_PARAD|nr:FAS1 domain containing protein [Parasponia andersonii]